MEFKNYCQNLQELSFSESTQINGGGGESGWYWIFYGIGVICSFPGQVREMNADNIGDK